MCQNNMKKIRCKWVKDSTLMKKYHDLEWGVPQHDDQILFEMLTLEGAQAGLSWATILNRRKNYQKVFKNFNINLVSKFTIQDVRRLMKDSSIIRNRSKIESTISNAKAILKIQEEFNTFSKYIWSFTGYKSIINKFNKLEEIPSKTELSNKISKDLKKRGFTFVGPKIIYAYMQSIGLVNDHLEVCDFKFKN